MHEIDRTEYGLKLNMSDSLDEQEMSEFCDKVRSEIDRQAGQFCVFADHQGLQTLPDGAAKELAELMKYASKNGLKRSAAACDSATTTLQTQRLAEKARDGEHSAFIDADEVSDPEGAAIDWFETGTSPA